MSFCRVCNTIPCKCTSAVNYPEDFAAALKYVAATNAIALAEEMAALRKDAERYRLLRQHVVDCYIVSGTGVALDAQLDTYLKEEA